VRGTASAGERFRYYRPAVLYSISLFVLTAAVWAAHALTRPAEPPSVVLIVVDSLRADHLGLYGYDRPTSPNIDSLGRRGAVFHRAYTAETLSGPAIASVMTSLYPVTHGVIYNGYQLHEDAQTLADLLRTRGFRTAAFVSDELVGDSVGFHRGFDTFEVSEVPGFPTPDRSMKVETRSFDLARRWLEERRGQRFFLWLHAQQPHWSYDPIPPFDRRFDPDVPPDFPYRSYLKLKDALAKGGIGARDEERVVALYDGEIAFVDEQLGAIFHELAQHERPPLTVLLADHGELLFEPQNDRRVGHGGGRYHEAAMRIPLIVVPPQAAAPVTADVRALVSGIDVLPTILDYVGLRPPPVVEGRSLRPLIEGGASTHHDAVYAMYLRHGPAEMSLAVRDERYKLVYHTADGGQDELYDLLQDPREQRNIARQLPGETNRLREQLLVWFASRPARPPRDHGALRPEVEALLRKAGYLEQDERR